MAFHQNDILDEMATDMGFAGEEQDNIMELAVETPDRPPPSVPTNKGISGEQRVCVCDMPTAISV